MSASLSAHKLMRTRYVGVNELVLAAEPGRFSRLLDFV